MTLTNEPYNWQDKGPRLTIDKGWAGITDIDAATAYDKVAPIKFGHWVYTMITKDNIHERD